MPELEAEIGRLLLAKKLTLGTVESATGGLIAARIIDVPGSSDYFKGGIVSYSNEVKMRCVGVRRETLDELGAVSAPVAEQMAAGGRRVLRVDICLSDTGIAGPGGANPGKPVGLFYLGLADQDGASARRHDFRGTREENRRQAVEAALAWLKTYLEGLP
jgi:nicotinamide-nucleotide amidase